MATLIPKLLVRAVQSSRRSPAHLLVAAGATMVALAMPGTVIAQAITTVAGTGNTGFSGDGGAAGAANLTYPSGAAIDTAGNVYFADTANHRVRKINAGTSVITTVAGNGSMSFSGDGAAATSASLSFPAAVAVDVAGNVYIADTGNSRVRKVAANGTITTVAGNGIVGYSGDGGLATSASLYYPTSVAVDAAGNVYVSDTFNHRIRVVAALTSMITTVAGTGTAGFAGDAGPASAAKLYFPEALALNPAGTLFVADTYNHRIRSVGGTISTVAGNGTAGYGGDGAAATSANLHYPAGLASDSGGNLFVADLGNNRIRFVSSVGGMITTFAGNGAVGYSGDGGDPVLATLSFPRGVAVDALGKVYTADTANHRIRAIGTANSVTLNVTKAGTGSGTVTSAPAVISCGVSCLRSFTIGSVVTLTATPDAGSTFDGWSGGGCSGTGTCSVTLNTATTVTASFSGAASSVRMVNVSTRGQVQTGDGVMIGGFIIGGTTPKKVLVTARGPSLTALGVPGALANPVLQLYSGQTVVATNDDWASAANAGEIQATGVAPTNTFESAILMTLNPGAYTAIVSGVGGVTGVGLVEAFEIDHPESQLVNISTRGPVQTGDSVLIGGFVIQGSSPKTVLITARGPSLASLGILGTLANPVLQLYSGQTIVASNDDWATASNAQQIQATGLAPGNALESAILVTLNPGAYTAIVSGSAGGTGIGIVEFFSQ